MTNKRRGDRDNNNDRDNDNVSTCGVNSFPTGTDVLMADGSYLAIDMIRPGDRVIAANTTTDVWSSRPVLDQWSHLDDGRMATATLTDGSTVTATDHHQFWVASDGAWVELDDVRPGDFHLTPDGVTEVAALQVSNRQDTMVWELDIAIDDTFTVHTGTHDVLVHNQDPCGPSKWIDDDDEVIWPPNRGFDGPALPDLLQPGTRIDRYGFDGGTFVSPDGTPYGQRALAPGSADKPHTVYEVVKPIDGVQTGRVAPWFDEPGGGIQHELPQSVKQLIEDGFLREVP